MKSSRSKKGKKGGRVVGGKQMDTDAGNLNAQYRSGRKVADDLVRLLLPWFHGYASSSDILGAFMWSTFLRVPTPKELGEENVSRFKTVYCLNDASGDLTTSGGQDGGIADPNDPRAIKEQLRMQNTNTLLNKKGLKSSAKGLGFDEDDMPCGAHGAKVRGMGVAAEDGDYTVKDLTKSSLIGREGSHFQEIPGDDVKMGVESGSTIHKEGIHNRSNG